MGSYREYDEQYRYADRDFKIGDRVVFIGPPPDQENLSMTVPPHQHKLYQKKGRIAYGPTESFRCYPEEPEDCQLGRMVWVIFDNDAQPIRQVDWDWLVKERDEA